MITHKPLSADLDRKILVVGCDGRQGSAVFEVLKSIGRSVVVGVDQSDDVGSTIASGGFQVVVSCAPFSCSEGLAKTCFKARSLWADLGGNPSVSRKVGEMAASHGCIAVTDLGLAPGFIEHFVLKLLHEAGRPAPWRVSVYCGGVPEYPAGSMKHGIYFSMEGLVNEYFNEECEALLNGEVAHVELLGDVEDLDLIGLSGMQAANTAGNVTRTFLDEMRREGVLECRYKTVRHSGHWALVRFLSRECGLSKDAVADIFSRSCFSAGPDVVHVAVVREHASSRNVSSFRIGPSESMSAMQKATAVPAAAAVELMIDLAEGDFTSTSVNPKVFALSDQYWETIRRFLPSIRMPWFD